MLNCSSLGGLSPRNVWGLIFLKKSFGQRDHEAQKMDVPYHDDAAQSSEISGDAEDVRMMFPQWIVTSIVKMKVPS